MTKRLAPTSAGRAPLNKGRPGASDIRVRRIVASSDQDKQLRAELAEGLGYFPASLAAEDVARYREQIAERKAREEAGERDDRGRADTSGASGTTSSKRSEEPRWRPRAARRWPTCMRTCSGINELAQRPTRRVQTNCVVAEGLQRARQPGRRYGKGGSRAGAASPARASCLGVQGRRPIRPRSRGVCRGSG